MKKIFICVYTFLFFTASSGEDIEIVDLLDKDQYTWSGYNLGNTKINVTAANFSIAVTINSCDIGNNDLIPNEEYLILKEGKKEITSSDDGYIFAYIKKPTTLYFFSSSVILELHAPTPLQKKCNVIFVKGDVEDTTLPPVTTTETAPTSSPDVSKYSTVMISGINIDEFNHDKDLILELEEILVKMATEYTQTEGFCLKEEISIKNIEIHTLEQCPTKLPDFETCVTLVYAIPVKIDEEKSLWKGYQLTQQHLDIMWSRLADKYLKNGLNTYTEPSVTTLVTWWIITITVGTIVFVLVLGSIHLGWKRRQVRIRAIKHQNEDYMPEIRNITDMSLTPPYFQSIPPMFDKSSRINPPYSEERHGADNEGYQYDEIPNYEEGQTTV